MEFMKLLQILTYFSEQILNFAKQICHISSVIIHLDGSRIFGLFWKGKNLAHSRIILCFILTYLDIVELQWLEGL